MSRGGMCKLPFGGCNHKEAVPGKDCPVCGRTKNERLDKFDFATGQGFLDCMNSPGDSPEKRIALQLISSTAHEYLFFGLGQNCIRIDRFFEASDFFFRVRSNDPDTWGKCRTIRTCAVSEETGKREVTVQVLDDSTIKSMCFDRWYSLAGLDNQMPLDHFCKWLKIKRRKTLEDNQAQVREYIEWLGEPNLRAAGIWQESFEFMKDWRHVLEILVEPSEPSYLAALINFHEQKKPRKTFCQTNYEHVELLEKQGCLRAPKEKLTRKDLEKSRPLAVLLPIIPDGDSSEEFVHDPAYHSSGGSSQLPN